MGTHPRLKRIKLKRWELRKAIFGIVVLGLISGGGSWVKPTLPLLVKAIVEYFREEKKLNLEEKKVRRAFADYEENDIFSFEKKGGDVYVTLNNKNPTVIKYSLKSILDFKIKQKKHNGKWYLVFFDVPELQRNKRDYLRLFLTKLGFYAYQKSVYILPYDCRAEIGQIKRVVEGGKYIKYVVASEIEDEEKIKRHFKIV